MSIDMSINKNILKVEKTVVVGEKFFNKCSESK